MVGSIHLSVLMAARDERSTETSVLSSVTDVMRVQRMRIIVASPWEMLSIFEGFKIGNREWDKPGVSSLDWKRRTMKALTLSSREGWAIKATMRS